MMPDMPKKDMEKTMSDRMDQARAECEQAVGKSMAGKKPAPGSN